MAYAIRKDGTGWRHVDGLDDICPDEVFSETQPAPIAPNAWTEYQSQAQAALDKTSVTIERIVEGVAAGTCAFTNSDVVAFMDYRKALRTIISATIGDPARPLPVKPGYPAGT